MNIGIAEAVVKNGEITTFNIINAGNSFPSSDAIFSDGIELQLNADPSMAINKQGWRKWKDLESA